MFEQKGINEFRTENGTLKYWTDPNFPSTTHLMLEIPLKDFDYNDEGLRSEVLQSWSSTKHFPSRFVAMNKFIDQIEEICLSSQFFLNATKKDDGYQEPKCVFVFTKRRGAKVVELLKNLISF